jgi:hypothetical protein
MSADRLRRRSDEALGRALADARPEWPPSPPLVPIVLARIDERRQTDVGWAARLSLPSRRRTVLVLVAILLTLAATTLAAKLVIDLGAETVRILAGPPPSDTPTRVTAVRDLGEPVADLVEARARAGFDPVVPARSGTPDAIWVSDGPPDPFSTQGTWIVLAWSASPRAPAIEGLNWGAVLMEFHGRVDLAVKTLYEDGESAIRPVKVGGRPGYWVTGAHTLTLNEPDGLAPISVRVTGNVLLWHDGELTLRLETAEGLDAALAIAESIA